MKQDSFSGNHSAVSVINNFVPKESVYYYTRKQPLEEKAKLPLEMAKPLYNLVMSVRFEAVFSKGVSLQLFLLRR